MADVVLLAVSSTLACIIPKRSTGFLGIPIVETALITMTLFTSLSLVSLSILEIAPSSWLLLLTPYGTQHLPHRQGLISMAFAYRSLLTVISFMSLILSPCLGGTKIFCRKRTPIDPELAKKSQVFLMRKHYLLFDTIENCLRLLLRLIHTMLMRPIFLVMKNCFYPERKIGNILVMFSKNNASNGASCSEESCGSRCRLQRENTIIASIVGVSLTLAIMSVVGPMVINTKDVPVLTRTTSWLCALGILSSALINGFGSVSLPYSCLAGIYLQPIPVEAIVKAEVELQKANANLTERRSELSGTALDLGTSLKKRTFTNLGEEISQRKRNAQNEVDFLESLVNEMNWDLSEMRASYKSALSARTKIGLVRSWIGAFFSVILLVRLIYAIQFLSTKDIHKVSIHNSARGDPVTMILVWLSGHNMVTQHEYNMLSQFISLALTAILSFSQIRTLIQTIRSIHRRLKHFCSKYICFSYDVMPIGIEHIYPQLLSTFISCYFLACVVLTKMMLPSQYREALTVALGGPEVFQVRSYAVNGAFCLSAMTSVLFFFVLHGIQRQNIKRYLRSEEYDNLQLDP